MAERPTIKKDWEIDILIEGGKRHSDILKELARMIKPGITPDELNRRAIELVEEGGDIAAFLNFKPRGAKKPYPSALCVSVNDEVVHGISKDNKKPLKEGDIVSIDLGLKHKDLITDSAITVAVGKVSNELEQLLRVTKEALYRGIEEAREGKTTGDIGYAIENYVKTNNYGIVRELSGHGVGYSVHEDPFVPNYGKRNKGERLSAGMVIAIEPMLNIGDEDIVLDDDGYTYRTKDELPSAHFEHTVVITQGDPIILTE